MLTAFPELYAHHHVPRQEGPLEAASFDFRGANLEDASLADANLVGANFRGASLVGASLAGASLVGASLVGADLVGANLVGANLARAFLKYASLADASLVGANLRGASLADANLENANLARAFLKYASLADANLVGANFRGANLVGASLAGANLENANLAGANLENANLAGTCLDPDAPIPPCDLSRFDPDPTDPARVLAWRTARSIRAGNTRYLPETTYVAPVFSVAATECHPGLYVWSRASEAREWGERGGCPEIARVSVARADLHRAGNKWRCRALTVLDVEAP